MDSVRASTGALCPKKLTNSQPQADPKAVYGIIEYTKRIVSFYENDEFILSLSFQQIMRYSKSLLAIHLVYLIRQTRDKLIINQTDPDVFKMILNFYEEGLWPCYCTNGVVTYGYDPEVNTREDFEDMLSYYNLPEFSSIQQVNETVAKRRPLVPKSIPSINDLGELKSIESYYILDKIPTCVVFYVKSDDGTTQYIPLSKEDLMLYPDSHLTVIAATLCLDEIELYGFTASTLVEIWNFYKEGLWCFNPYKISERHKFTLIGPDGYVMNSFQEMCEYLNLPDNFDDAYISDDEELSSNTLAIMDDFDPYEPSDDDEDSSDGCSRAREIFEEAFWFDPGY